MNPRGVLPQPQCPWQWDITPVNVALVAASGVWRTTRVSKLLCSDLGGLRDISDIRTCFGCV